MEISGDGLENVLPGACGGFISDGNGRACADGADAIGHDAVPGPVSAADDVARPRRGDADGAGGREIGFAEAGDDELRGALAGAVGIVTAHGVLFAVGMEPLAVFVAFIGGDADDGAGLGVAADRIEEMGGAHDVDGEGFDRDVVGEADERLGCEVEDDIRLAVGQRAGEGGAVEEVGAGVRVDARGEAELAVEEFVRLGDEGKAVDLRSEGEQPFGHPGTFETGVAGEEDAFVLVEVGEHDERVGNRERKEEEDLYNRENREVTRKGRGLWKLGNREMREIARKWEEGEVER